MLNFFSQSLCSIDLTQVVTIAYPGTVIARQEEGGG